MLTDSLRTTIQLAYRSFLRHNGLQPRHGQRQMIAEIARSLTSGTSDAVGRRIGVPPVSVIEAGTGTGKTVAYILGALPVAQALDKTLVVATATVALQEQLVFKDLPAIQASSELDFTYALAKGRGRYLCLARFETLLGEGQMPQAELGLYPDEGGVDAELRGELESMLEALNRGNWDGDRDAWPGALSPALWSRLATDHSQCSGRRCPHVRECCFFRARERLHEVDLIVANHDLVLADLALGGGAILPEPEDAIYVFDEGHHLPDKALNHFACHTRLGASVRNLEQIEKLAAGLATDLPATSKLHSHLQALPPLVARCKEQLELTGPVLEDLLQQAAENREGRMRFRFVNGEVPADLSETALQLQRDYEALLSHLDVLAAELEEALGDGAHGIDATLAEQWYPAVGLLRARAASAGDLWRGYADTAASDPPTARWLAQVESGGQGDLELRSSPILAASVLDEVLWSRCFGAVVTSATLAAMGRFDRFVMRSGVPASATFAIVPSPFDHAAAATLAVPGMPCEPGAADAHSEAVASMLPELLAEPEGSLVLFSSRRQLEQVWQLLPEEWRERVLLQDRFGKQELLDRHREAVDGGTASVIFGLASFAEGIDLPGRYCQHVVVAKIPFAVPDDPLEAAVAEWVSARGGNAFMEISVPDAALRLVQASGRLLRCETDTGRISLLDRRVVSKRYGRALLDSLPPYRREIG